jgi:hypothetical protein
MSPCNCGKSSVKRTWVFTSKDGSVTQEYPSQVQAQARVIRDGGGRITVKTA